MDELIRQAWVDAHKIAIIEHGEEMGIENFEIAEFCWQELDKLEREDKFFTVYFRLLEERGLKQ